VKIKASLEAVATIFDRVNMAGTRIKQSDIVLAYIAVHNSGWVRGKFMEYLNDLDEEGFYFDPTIIIRGITAIGENKTVLRDVSDDFIRNENGVLDKAFKKFKECMSRLIHKFRSAGILTSDLIYAKNSVIPLIYLCHKFGTTFNFKKALFYLILALWYGRYSGAAEATLQEDINKIKEAKNFDEAIAKLVENFPKINVTKEIVKNAVYYQGIGRILKLILYLIVYKNGATDWFTGVRLGYTRHNEINKDFGIEEHHFFPRSLLRKQNIETDKIHSLANIVFINPGTNKRLRTQPADYIKKYKIQKEDLKKQLIPLNEKLWYIEKFKEFINERSRLIAEEINNYLKDLCPEYFK